MDEIQKEILEKLNKNLPAKEKPLSKTEKDFQDDYEFSRKKLKNLMNKGEEVIDNFLQIALETNDPKIMSNFAAYLDTMGNLSEKLMNNAKSKSEVDKNVNGGVGKIGTQNNTVFIGTAQDYLKQAKEEQKKLDDIIDVEVIEDGSK